jgi:hypothetical protein
MLERGWAVEEQSFEDVLEKLSQVAEKHRLRRQKALRDSKEDLRTQLNWYWPWGNLAYEALGLNHFDSFGGQIRRDVADKFETFKTESLERLRGMFGEQGVEKLAPENAYAEAEYWEAAVSVLGERGSAEDAELVCAQLTHASRDVRLAALRALLSLDATRAAEEAERLAADEDLTDEQRGEAARIAIAHSPDAVFALTDSKHENVRALAVSALPEGEAGLERLKEFLRATDDAVRVAAAKRLGAVIPREDLETVLRKYTAGGQYYYNVVVWLDRLVYCPEPFLARYLAN